MLGELHWENGTQDFDMRDGGKARVTIAERNLVFEVLVNSTLVDLFQKSVIIAADEHKLNFILKDDQTWN